MTKLPCLLRHHRYSFAIVSKDFGIYLIVMISWHRTIMYSRPTSINRGPIDCVTHCVSWPDAYKTIKRYLYHFIPMKLPIDHRCKELHTCFTTYLSFLNAVLRKRYNSSSTVLLIKENSLQRSWYYQFARYFVEHFLLFSCLSENYYLVELAFLKHSLGLFVVIVFSTFSPFYSAKMHRIRFRAVTVYGHRNARCSSMFKHNVKTCIFLNDKAHDQFLFVRFYYALPLPTTESSEKCGGKIQLLIFFLPILNKSEYKTFKCSLYFEICLVRCLEHCARRSDSCNRKHNAPATWYGEGRQPSHCHFNSYDKA